MHVEEFNAIKPTIPSLPGVYRFYDKDSTIIYIGKARVLKHRVGSYFQGVHLLSGKTQKLVAHIDHLDWIACPDEHDALLLENNLIKQWKPKYNINLKDDKTYPYVVIRKEPFPRVYMTRKRTMEKTMEYFGPYTSIHLIKELMQHIRDQIPLRTCALPLSEKNIAQKNYRPCLEYHIKKCLAPCAKLQTPQSYETHIAQVRMLLKGNFKSLVQEYKRLMNEKSAQLQFEEAQMYKEKIEAIAQLKHQSFFDFNADMDLDIVGFKVEQGLLWANFSALRQGCILQSETRSFSLENQEASDDVMATIIFDWREKFESTCTEIIANQTIDLMTDRLALSVPKQGLKKQMIEWVMKNISQHIHHQQLHVHQHLVRHQLLHEMKEKLKLHTVPLVIESFDNSHFQGDAQVSAMVVFREGLPCKKEYRTFHIKSTTQIDDYASMREVIYRRYLRRINEGKALPDLMVIDGGKGQLNEAVASLESLGLRHQISILSIAKKEEHLFFPGDQEPLKLDSKDPVLRFIQQIRDETHRFVIAFHRKTKIKQTLKGGKKSNF